MEGGDPHKSMKEAARARLTSGLKRTAASSLAQESQT